MAGKRASDMLLKIGDGADPEVFTTIAALTASSMTLGGDAIDTTAADSVSAAATTKLVRELIAGGVTHLDASGDVRIKKLGYEQTLVTLKMSGNPIANWQIVVPGIGTFEGAFHLNTLEFGGQDTQNGEVTGSIALVSAGDFTFTAEA